MLHGYFREVWNVLFSMVKYDDTRIVGVHCTKQSVGIIVGGVCPNIIRI